MVSVLYWRLLGMQLTPPSDMRELLCVVFHACTDGSGTRHVGCGAGRLYQRHIRQIIRRLLVTTCNKKSLQTCCQS